jgi:uncharacterized protein
VADEVDDLLTPDSVGRMRPDVVVSCGDLPFDYLEYLVTIAGVPLLYVPGNHDGRVSRTRSSVGVVQPGAGGVGLGPAWDRPPDAEQRPAGPGGCTNLDGGVVRVKGIRFAGLGGSIRYKPGPNQYTQAEMRRRALRLELRAAMRPARVCRRIDVLVTHAPPLGVGDGDDPCHEGFSAFHRLTRALRPALVVHGHIHPYGRAKPDRWLEGARVVNAVPTRLIEVEAPRETVRADGPAVHVPEGP